MHQPVNDYPCIGKISNELDCDQHLQKSDQKVRKPHQTMMVALFFKRRQDKTRQDRTGRDGTGRDRTGQDRKGRDGTGRDGTG